MTIGTNLARIRLGPVRVAGHTVLLRPPIYSDFEDWRRLRIRNQNLIEPFWVSSTLSWNDRHTETLWIRECIIQRVNGRSRRNISVVIEVDGRLAGQCSLNAIDMFRATGELGIWVDSDLGQRGIGGVATAMLSDFAFTTLGLDRITAPICVDNEPASQGAALGLVAEAVMSRYFDAGGRRKDHTLWVAHRSGMPPNGFTQWWIERIGDQSADYDTQVGLHVDYCGRLTRLPRTRVAGMTQLRFCVGKRLQAFAQRQDHKPTSLGPVGSPPVRLRAELNRCPQRRRNAAPVDMRGLPTPAGAAKQSTLQRVVRNLLGRLSAPDASRMTYSIDLGGAVVGQCGLINIDRFKRMADVWVRVDITNRHFEISETALSLLLDHAFDTVGLDRVATTCLIGDAYGASLVEKIGFKVEGTLRDHVDAMGQRGDHSLWAVTRIQAASSPMGCADRGKGSDPSVPL